MRVFLSYAGEDRDIAEEAQLALVGAGHEVFFDKASLPAGGDYHERIERAVKVTDAFIFFISPHSVANGSYALTELRFARTKWPHPKGHLLPVRLRNTVWEDIPPYLKSITVLEPEGNVAAEIVAAVGAMSSIRGPRKNKILVVAILIIGVFSVALLASGPNARQLIVMFVRSVFSSFLTVDGGPDCPEITRIEVTKMDYNKFPPEFRIVKVCPQ